MHAKVNETGVSGDCPGDRASPHRTASVIHAMPPYRLVQLRNGTWAVHSTADAETMHPGGGPVAEATALYAEQLRIPERVRQSREAFVVWDIGLGAAANGLAAIRACEQLSAQLHLVSFDRTDEPLRFAIENQQKLDYIRPWRHALEALIREGETHFTYERLHVSWELHLGDFAKELSCVGSPKPHAIFFDPFSPRANPGMWTKTLFSDLHAVLDPRRACSLATYSRSTMVRTAMLLAGFFVGRGRGTGLKEETTIAATTLELMDEPLDESWLKRAERSRSAEPLLGSAYTQASLTPATLEKLRAHPQFRTR